jgi:hypothetical protein
VRNVLKICNWIIFLLGVLMFLASAVVGKIIMSSLVPRSSSSRKEANGRYVVKVKAQPSHGVASRRLRNPLSANGTQHLNALSTLLGRDPFDVPMRWSQICRGLYALSAGRVRLLRNTYSGLRESNWVMAVGSFCASPAVFQPDNAPANGHEGSEVGIRRVGEAGIQFTLRWYRKASEAGNADAQAGLGQKYEDGEGVEDVPMKNEDAA